MKEHGQFVVSKAGQVLLFAGRGPWNDASLRKGSLEMSSTIAKIDKTHPWAQVSLLFGDSLLIPSAHKKFIQSTKGRKELGLCALAIVIKDSAIGSLIKNQLSEAYVQAEIEHAFFDSIEDALLWLKNQSFDINGEDIAAFLDTCVFAH